MKSFNKTAFSRQEDIQIQIPTSRLGFDIKFAAKGSAGSLLANLDTVRVRMRLVSPAVGTKTIIERMTLRALFEIGASSEGFYEIYENEVTGLEAFIASGSVLVARGGALALTNQSYLSLDVESDVEIAESSIYSIAHPKTTNTYLHYNPQTIIAGIQNIPLANATQVVIPMAKVSNIQLSYPANVIEFTQAELYHEARTLNDIVYVNTRTGNIKAGYDKLVVLPTTDYASGLQASRLQVEPTGAAGQFSVYLLEENTL